MKGALLLILLIAIVGGCWIFYSNHRNRQILESKVVEYESQLNQANTKIANKEKEIGVLTVENERKDAALKLMRLDTRRAKFHVIETGENDGRAFHTLQFTEFSKDQVPIGTPRQVTIQGDQAYIDCWVVKFDDDYVENADLARGTALFVFKSIFGNEEAPSAGTVLDHTGTVPEIYQSDPTLAALSGDIFVDFWQIAHDPKKAEELGIRAVHGQAVSMKLRQGFDYWVTIRNAGGISIKAVQQ